MEPQFDDKPPRFACTQRLFADNLPQDAISPLLICCTLPLFACKLFPFGAGSVVQTGQLYMPLLEQSEQSVSEEAVEDEGGVDHR